METLLSAALSATIGGCIAFFGSIHLHKKQRKHDRCLQLTAKRQEIYLEAIGEFLESGKAVLDGWREMGKVDRRSDKSGSYESARNDMSMAKERLQLQVDRLDLFGSKRLTTQVRTTRESLDRLGTAIFDSQRKERTHKERPDGSGCDPNGDAWISAVERVGRRYKCLKKNLEALKSCMRAELLAQANSSKDGHL